MPLATGEETLLVLPGFDVKLLEKQGRLVDNIAWMKGVKNLPEMIKLLKDSGGFSEKSQLLIAKRCSLHDEELWKGEIQNALDLKFPEDYFATIMVRRRPSDA
jgi:precorrin-2 methylase